MNGSFLGNLPKILLVLPFDGQDKQVFPSRLLLNPQSSPFSSILHHPAP